jgi:predicted transcriptional regulator
MKTVSANLPDALATQLKALAVAFNISKDELVTRSLEAYLSGLAKAAEFQPIGCGLWQDREDLRDSVSWVRKPRQAEWHR